MSIKVWALNKETGEVMHINEVTKDMKGKMICLDDNCGEELLICKGEVNAPYFSHKSNSECCGGSTETLLTMLCKQILSKCAQFTLPEESVIFRSKKIVYAPKRNILVREVELNAQVGNYRIPIKLTDFSDIEYYIEPTIRGMSASRVEALRKFDINVIEIDLRKYAKTNGDFDKEDLTKFVINGCGVKNFVCSKRINNVEMKVKESEYKCNGDFIVCPAKDYEGVVAKTTCEYCPFYLYKEKDGIVCTGKGCYSEASDFDIDSFERRKSKYANRIPKSIWGVPKVTSTDVFGNCEDCGSALSLYACGMRNETIAGIPMLYEKTEHSLYAVCPECGKRKPLLCPVCGRELHIHINRKEANGRVFAGCEGYATSSCNFTVTLFTSSPCKDNYSGELESIGSIMNLYTNFDESWEKIRNFRRKR